MAIRPPISAPPISPKGASVRARQLEGVASALLDALDTAPPPRGGAR
jgi:hypothetical protein